MPETALSGDSVRDLLAKLVNNQGVAAPGGNPDATDVQFVAPNRLLGSDGAGAAKEYTVGETRTFLGLATGDSPTFLALTANSLTSATGQALTLATLDTNRNIVLTPHGTGQVRLEPAGGGVRLPSTATGGLQLYNTSDETTNYESGSAFWSGNSFYIYTQKGGSGSARFLRLGSANGTTGSSKVELAIAYGQNPNVDFRSFETLSSARSFMTLAHSGSYTNTSGTSNWLSLLPIYNQASGTAANTDLLINRTETAVGSGAQRLLDLQVGGTSRFSISNTGAVLLANQTSGPGAGAGTLANAPSAGDPDFWLPVSINGTAHWIPAWAA